MDEGTARAAVVTVAQMMESAGLAESFGHVSARWGEGFLITCTQPFSVADAGDVIRVKDSAAPPLAGRNLPLETPMHAALYLARSDIGAVCRGHPPAVVAWGTGTGDLPLLHGLGALAGVTVPVHTDVDLITTPEQAAVLAATLGLGSSLILRANGCLAVGASLLEALTRLYYLEERARVALQSPPSEGEEIDWEERIRHTEPELARAMAWVESTFATTSSQFMSRAFRKHRRGAGRAMRTNRARSGRHSM